MAPVGRYINWFLEVYNEFVLVPKIWTLWTPTSAWDQRDVFDVVGKLNRWFRYDRFARLVFHVLKIYHIIQRLLFINNIYIYYIYIYVYIHTVHCKPTKCARLPLPTTPINKPLPRSQQMLRCPLSRLSLRIFHGLMGNESLIKIHSATGGFFWNPCWPNPRLPDQFHQWSKGIIQ